MTEARRYLIDLARRVSVAYTELPSARAAMVSGSAAEGESDFYSDVDMMIYYEALPSDEVLEQARLRNHGGERLWQVGNRDNGVLMESYPVAGVECQIVHATIAAWERDMALILEEHQVESPLQKALSGLLNGLPLYGEEWILKWKARASTYPEALREKMVEHYLKFFPIWAMQERFFSRDAELWFHQIRVETLQNLLGVLAGLNRVYYTTFQFKRTSAFIHQLTVRPTDLETRLNRTLAASSRDAALLIEQLIRETIDLIEREMPQINTTSVRRRVELSIKPWQLPSSPHHTSG